MRDHERERVGVRRTRVDEVDPERVGSVATELGLELRERVQTRLGGGEVVPVGPVAAQVLRVREREAL